MSSFHVLPGLPPYGPLALPVPFSATGMGTHKEGFVVEFLPGESASWVGNFQRGLSKFDLVVNEPGSNRLIVVAGGEAYLVDPLTRRCERTFGGAIQQYLAR